MQRNTQKRENIQTTILALLLAHKGGCTLRQLDNDYYELEGERIPYKDLGYVSLLSLLHSMSKTVLLENWNGVTTVRGIASEKSKHVHKLVTGQKSQKAPVGRKLFKPSHYYPRTTPPRIHIPAEILSRIIGLIKQHPDGVNKCYIFQQVHSFIPFANISLKDIEDQLHELPHIVYQTHNKIYPVQSKDKSLDRVENGKDVSSRLITQNGKDSKLAVVTAAGDEDSDDRLSYAEEDDFEFVPSTAVPKSDQTKLTAKTQSTSSFIRESVSKCQDKITEKDSAMEIKENNYNGNSVAETWTELNNNVKKDEQYCFQGNSAEILINERVKFRLQKLIQNHPNGIWCADLPEKYLEEYKISLNYCELGFNSVREFASQLPEIFHCVQIHDTGDFMLYDAQGELPSNKQKDKHKISNLIELHRIYEIEEEEALPGMVSLDTCKILIPDEVMTIGENVGQILVTDLLTQTVDPFIEVIVVEVFTPTFFWIQLRKKQKVFKKFMDDLHNFYVEKSQQYAIPPVVLEKGLNCACMYNGTWHRGIIKTVKPDFQVTVMFYDYGTLKTYSPDAIYYLHRIFSSLSAQAVPCGLVNVRPCKGPKWSRSATHNFAVKTSEIPLIATIASVNVEDNSMMVSLTNTLEEEDLHINDWLVEQNLAEHGKMEDKVDMNNLLLYVEENLMYNPEQCYEVENKVCESNETETTSEIITNVPLVSPHSTLNDKFLINSPLESRLRAEENLLQNIQNVLDQCCFASTVPTPSKGNNTNPFLQDDEPIRNQRTDTITPQRFMELWNENLQVQMQISATLNVLLNRVIANSAKNSNDNLTKDERTLNMIKNALLYANGQMAIFANCTGANATKIYENIVSPAANAYGGANTAMKNDVDVGYPVGLSAYPTSNPQPLSPAFNNRNLDLSSSTDLFRSNDILNATRNSNSTTPGFLMPTNNDFSSLNQSMTSQATPVSNKFNLDLQNYFANNVSGDATKATEFSTCNQIPLKETNPFRLSLAGKLQIPDPEETNCSYSQKNPEFGAELDLINFEDDTVATKFAKQNSFDSSKLANQSALDNSRAMFANQTSVDNSKHLNQSPSKNPMHANLSALDTFKCSNPSVFDNFTYPIPNSLDSSKYSNVSPLDNSTARYANQSPLDNFKYPIQSPLDSSKYTNQSTSDNSTSMHANQSALDNSTANYANQSPWDNFKYPIQSPLDSSKYTNQTTSDNSTSMYANQSALDNSAAKYANQKPLDNSRYASQSPLDNFKYPNQSALENSRYLNQSPLDNTNYPSLSPLDNSKYPNQGAFDNFRYSNQSPLDNSNCKYPNQSALEISRYANRSPLDNSKYPNQIPLDKPVAKYANQIPLDSSKYANQGTLDDRRGAPFNPYQYFVPEPLPSNINDLKNNSVAFNPKPINHKWSVDDVSNAMSKISIGDQSTQHNAYKRDMEKHCFSPSEELQKLQKQPASLAIKIPKFIPPACTNNCRSPIVLPIKYPTVHSFASHQMCSSTPATEFRNTAIVCSQTPAAKTFNELTSGAAEKSWPKEFYCVPESVEEKVTYDMDQQQNAATNALNVEVNMDNKETKFQKKQVPVEPVAKETNFSAESKVFFRVVEISKRIVHVFHYKEEGWLLVTEFVEAFTGLDNPLDVLHLLHVPYIHILTGDDKTKVSIELVATNSKGTKATHNIQNGVTRLIVMPLKAALKVLYKLGIVSQREVNEALMHETFVNGSIVHDVWLITDAYREFKYRMESGQ